ncbi:MAG TPA: phospholipase D-like domain-containing protein [Burkholderiales bacterium]|nr:phospholipase D-like domain-containing protein [Burkholderiales bacterium]
MAAEDSAVTYVIVALLLVVIALLGLAIWSIKRHKDPHLGIRSDLPLERLIPSLSGLSLGMAFEGNAVEILENGAFFDALFAEIASAKRSIHFETFLWKDGVLGRRLAEALAERARAGVKVRVLVDANGGKKMGKPVQRLMQEAGCKFALYHTWTLNNIGVLAERDHRKITVIDGGVAFVGGHCIVDDWLGNAEDRGQVRDLSVRLRGPIVHAVQSAFSENWVEETGDLFIGEEYFRTLEPQGDAVVHLASVKPEGSAPAVKILHHLVICCAQKRLWIQNPYFIPEPDAIEAFAQAVKRGVDVRVMVPSSGASDMKMVQHAAHRNFDKLLAAGVRLFEYHKTLLHQKVMTVDGVWCAVGSSNFDDRSFETNDEITLGFLDAGLARQLEEIFERDRADCIEIEAAAWAKRGLWHRIVDNAWYLFNELL